MIVVIIVIDQTERRRREGDEKIDVVVVVAVIESRAGLIMNCSRSIASPAKQPRSVPDPAQVLLLLLLAPMQGRQQRCQLSTAAQRPWPCPS